MMPPIIKNKDVALKNYIITEIKSLEQLNLILKKFYKLNTENYDYAYKTTENLGLVIMNYDIYGHAELDYLTNHAKYGELPQIPANKLLLKELTIKVKISDR